MSLPAWDRVHAFFSPNAALRHGAALLAAGKAEPAFRLYAHATRSGLAEAEYRVGRCYLEGTGVPRSRSEALRWLAQAGRRGHTGAQCLLAAIHLDGAPGRPTRSRGSCPSDALFSDEAIKPDYSAAARWARMAAEAGAAEGQALLAYILTAGPEEIRDRDEADLWYARSAAGGCPRGMLGHALALARRGGDAATQHEVAAHLRRAADAGLPAALYLLGIMSEKGIGMPADPSTASDFFRRAAERGHRAGQTRWGAALVDGLGVEANLADGETWLRRAALAGDAEAAFRLGELHTRGGKLPANYVEAATWLQRAAEAGHAGAARALGQLYLTGSGVPRDPQEAARWFQISAAAGNASAQADLGNLALAGLGGEDDRSRIRSTFEKAAASGDLLAAFNYGVCLAQGFGIARDEEQAAVWLRKAADGVVNAQYWYGRALIEGRGVPRDASQGRAWMSRAAESEMPDAQVALAHMMLRGTGGERDPRGALALFEKAAGRGHVEAMFAAAVVHEGHHGVPADPAAAQRWLKAAAERGHALARARLGLPIDPPPRGQRDPRPPSEGSQTRAEVGSEAAEASKARSTQIASDEFTEPAMLSPTHDALCACGSGLRSLRCCALDPAYTAPPEASDSIRLLLTRAREALSAGQADAAEKMCLTLLDIAPRLPGALWMLHQVRRAAGDQKAATALLKRLVGLEPNNVEATQQLAMLLFQQGDLSAAEPHARNAVRLAPADPVSHNVMGMILTEAQRPHPAEYHYRRVLELSRSRDPILLANLAWNLKGQGRLGEARELYRESVKSAPRVFQTWFGWAQLEEADGDFAAAKSHLERAAEIRPDDPGLRVARATLLAREGNHGEALRVLETPSRSEDRATTPADPNVLLEKGRLLDRLQQYDQAFACFQEAKRVSREVTGKSYAQDQAVNLADRLRQFFVSDRLRLMPIASAREGHPQPIFILGFPRSGTTLTEQILSSHPRIAAGDELPFINEISDSISRLLGSPLTYPDALSELWLGDGRHGLESLRDAYLQRVAAMRIVDPASAWFTDKMPLNEMHLGLISLMFPQSPLIHILRHPLDVVVSAFSHHLTHGFFCAYDLETIARHYVLVMNLVQHYRQQMPLRYLPIRYEDMLDDMAGSVRRMLDFVGEPFDEKCVHFQDNRRLPRTPSYAQVSEKLYHRSRYRYRHYLKHLEPVIPILQPVIDHLGYSVS
jgi:TPR repeat protein